MQICLVYVRFTNGRMAVVSAGEQESEKWMTRVDTGAGATTYKIYGDVKTHGFNRRWPHSTGGMLS